MRFLILGLSLTFVVSACSATTAAPRDRYIAAINAQQNGNAKTYYDGMIALAKDAPDSRAGRKARANLSGGGMVTQMYVVGVLAAIAIPNFKKFQGRAKQSDAKTNLRSLYSAMALFQIENGRYPHSSSELGWKPGPGSKYIYLFGAQDSVAATSSPDGRRAQMMALANQMLSSLRVQPYVEAGKFLIVAVGDTDGDTGLDIWTIDHEQNLINPLSDI